MKTRKRFERKEFLDPLAERVLERLRAMKRGDVLPWSVVEELTGVQRYTTHWTSLRKRIGDGLRSERGIELWPVPGVGLQLATVPFQGHGIPIKRQQRAVRQFTKGVRAVRALPAAELSDADRRLVALKEAHLLTSRRLAKRNIRQQKREAEDRQPAPDAGAARRRIEQRA